MPTEQEIYNGLGQGYPIGPVVPGNQYSIGLAPQNLDATINIGSATMSMLDVILLTFCPIAAALGMIVALILKRDVFEEHLSNIKRILKALGFVFSGLILGLVIALFFVGSITPELTSVSRVLALSILLGYQAPSIWFSQEKIISKIIDKKVRDLVEQHKDG